ncbi:MAG TPA: ATP-binding cassette domain-containing protein [Ignavibacteriales bacterium]|jgi:cell division transport system ATP-binding protein|nr:ATP-binding cassette domain-containing protein [Ignavibacteriales bacterium]
MLTFNNVAFGYPNQPIFSDLNFRLEQGEMVFLIGKSGAGKSTFLQMIYMNILPQSGYVEVGKYSSQDIKNKDLPFLRRKIGVIFQDFKLLPDRNVYQNLEFVLEATGTSRRDIKRKIFTALSDVGLSHKQRNMPDELSGGEQQRIAIARAIINEPALILADEPTGNLDPETTDEIVSIIQKINTRGTSVIFATHNYELVRKAKAKIVKLENGVIKKAVLREK